MRHRFGDTPVNALDFRENSNGMKCGRGENISDKTKQHCVECVVIVGSKAFNCSLHTADFVMLCEIIDMNIHRLNSNILLN